MIAHRGASAYEPENSLAALRRAVELGADGVELDVHETADGCFVVHHDFALNGERIAELPLSRMSGYRLPNGESVPTLQSALATLPPPVQVFVEIKALTPERDAALLATLDTAPGRCRVHAFDHRIVRRLCAARPDISAGVLSASYPIEPLAQVRAAGAAALWQQEYLLDHPLVEQMHRGGCAVYAWTVDDAARIRALDGMGVDGICTNRPDVARAALA